MLMFLNLAAELNSGLRIPVSDNTAVRPAEDGGRLGTPGGELGRCHRERQDPTGYFCCPRGAPPGASGPHRRAGGTPHRSVPEHVLPPPKSGQGARRARSGAGRTLHPPPGPGRRNVAVSRMPRRGCRNRTGRWTTTRRWTWPRPIRGPPWGETSCSACSTDLCCSTSRRSPIHASLVRPFYFQWPLVESLV